MASGTVSAVIETANPTIEVVYLNVSTGNTYTSRKFNKIQAALLSSNDSGSGTMTTSFSGTVATIVTSTAKANCTLVLWGD